MNRPSHPFDGKYIVDKEGRRGYCGRIGSAILITEPCNECGYPDGHAPFKDQTKCHSFVACGDHGHACVLDYKHGGDCVKGLPHE